MTLDEAIERLTTIKEGWPMVDVDNYFLAVELGTEALKREQIRRRPPYIAPFGPLPGETEK